MPAGGYTVFPYYAQSLATNASSSAATTQTTVNIISSSFGQSAGSGSATQIRTALGTPQISSSYSTFAAGQDRITNISGGTNPFTGSILVPANLPAGTKIDFQFAGIVANGTGTDTLSLTLKLGDNTIFVTTAADPSTNGTFVISGWMSIETAGAGGVVDLFAMIKASFIAQSGFSLGHLGLQSLDMSSNNNITLSATWSDASTNDQIDLRMISSQIITLGPVT